MYEKPLEWMAVCGESVWHKIIRVATLVIAILAFVFLVMTGMTWAVAVVVVFAAISGWMQMHAYIEYEYCYFDDEVEISVIYNRQRRKKKMALAVSDVEYMTKKIQPQENTKYFCKKEENGRVYTLMVNQGGKRTAVVMEAEDAFVKVMEMKRKIR